MVTGDARSSLERCVGDVDAFLASAWGRTPWVHQGADVAALLTLDDVDELVTTRGLRAPAFRLVRRGEILPRASYTRSARVGSQAINDLLDPVKVLEHFADGATIVLQGLQRYWPPLTALCRDVEQVLTHHVQANAYITPAVSSGLRVHDDPHDVFALQTEGRKQWVIHEAGPDAPPTRELELGPGDCLYLPKGTPHAARTVDSHSVHITVGVRHVTWRTVLRRVVEEIGDELRLDDALPAGFATDPHAHAGVVALQLKALAAALADRDPAVVADDAARSFWRSRVAALDGQLRQLVTLDDVDDETVVRRRPGARCDIVRAGDRARLRLSDRSLSFPAAAETALRWIAERPTFRVADLAPLVDPSSRVLLVRRLVREGLLLAERG